MMQMRDTYWQLVDSLHKYTSLRRQQVLKMRDELDERAADDMIENASNDHNNHQLAWFIIYINSDLRLLSSDARVLIS